MLKSLLCFIFIITICYGANAQDNSTLLNRKDTTTMMMTAGGEEPNDPDDEFNIFLIVIAVGFMGAALGAVMAGAFVVFLFLSVSALLTIAGIVSASLLIGLYKRSLQAGFKAFLFISGSVLGIAFGLFVLWLINQFFHLNLTGYQMLFCGAGGGLAGGFLLGFIIYKMSKSILRIAYNKVKLTN
jgi:hypothetical protein